MTKCSQERQLRQRNTLPADICPYDFRLLFGCNICQTVIPGGARALMIQVTLNLTLKVIEGQI